MNKNQRERFVGMVENYISLWLSVRLGAPTSWVWECGDAFLFSRGEHVGIVLTSGIFEGFSVCLRWFGNSIDGQLYREL